MTLMTQISQASLIASLALEAEGIELFHTSGHEGYVRLPVDEHREVWPVRSTAFRRWLARQYFNTMAGAPGGQALTDGLGVLEGIALFDGHERDVHLRLAEHEGDIFLDLADTQWRAVRISASGWEVVVDPPVRFRRARGMLPLPDPIAGGSLEALWQYINVPDDEWPLLAGWIVGTLRPRGPYAVLLIYGEQGSAKSTLVRIARSLVDPNEAPVRREPRNGQDLIVAARNGLVVAFDNVSHLSQELSDDLARLATGSGFGARQLYTDLEEVVVHVSRPIALNGIEEFAVRGDLLDRAVTLNLPPISEYRDEDEFWSSFDTDHPRILGALLDAASHALANHATTIAPNIRMADFARWVSAAEPALNLEAGSFVTAYRTNREQAVRLTLDASPISAPVIEVAAKGFEGTATALLARLNELVSDEVRKQREWPKAAHTLSGRLRRLAPALRRVQVYVAFDRNTQGRSLRISTGPQGSVIGVTKRHRQGVPGQAVTLDDANDASQQPSTSGPPGDETPDEGDIERYAALARQVQQEKEKQ
ncbi:MAG TPA: hypothetical protein VHI53_14235 [Gaiellaceae bacterium]|jgi:hypothetical protein|nr:hypothetical protein [Gaiellaceae bacterium]